jgi:hypothetical protein
MGLFFFMVILGLIMVISTIILIAVLASGKSKSRKMSNPFRIIYFSLWGIFFGIFAAVGTITPTSEADRIEAEVFAEIEEKKEPEKVFASIPMNLVVSWSEVENLDGGMKYEDVATIIGVKGKLVDANKDPGSELVTYKWENSPTSWLLVNFTKDDKGTLYLYNFYTMGIEKDIY